MPKRILFVDDDAYLLEGLRDALRAQRRTWAMSFVGSADEALDELACEPYDVVVSDMRMPKIDGARLLARVRELYPTTVRIVLSGQAEMEMVARAAAVAHRLLAKPCDADASCRSDRARLHAPGDDRAGRAQSPHRGSVGAALRTTDVRRADRAAVVRRVERGRRGADRGGRHGDGGEGAAARQLRVLRPPHQREGC